MEGQFSELKISHKGIDLVLKTDNTIYVENNSSQKFHISVLNPHIDYSGYVNYNFESGIWVSTNPPTWVDSGTNISVEVILTSHNFRFKFLVHFLDRTISIEEEDTYIIKNFEIVPIGVTFVISSYKSQNYINETLNSIMNLKKEYHNFEILVGIDGCGDVLKKITENEYPDYIKFYFFPENNGQRIVINSLIQKSKNENIVIFDSDDLIHKDFLKYYFKEINNCDVLNWGHYVYIDGSEFNESNMDKSFKYLGCFAIRKSKFLELNGFFPWRCHGDSEFQERIVIKELKIKNLEIPLFYYRIRNESLSRDSLTKPQSILRKTYVSLMDEKRVFNLWNNPSRLYTSNCLKIK